jgi:hypothetical protein
MIEGRSKIIELNASRAIIIPKRIFTDSACPFSEGSVVKVKLEKGKLIIEAV